MTKHVSSEESVSKHFARIVAVAEACATEGIFPVETGNIDCELCPGREGCLSYWDESVVSLPLGPKSVNRYVNEVAWRLEDFKNGNLKGSRRRGLLLRLVAAISYAISWKHREDSLEKEE